MALYSTRLFQLTSKKVTEKDRHWEISPNKGDEIDVADQPIMARLPALEPGTETLDIIVFTWNLNGWRYSSEAHSPDIRCGGFVW